MAKKHHHQQSHPQDQRAPEAAGLVVTQPAPTEPAPHMPTLAELASNPSPSDVLPATDAADADPFADGGYAEQFAQADAQSAPADAYGAEFDGSQYVEELPARIIAPPDDTVAAVLLAAGRWYNDAEVLGKAIRKHLPAVAAEIELHAFLSRLELLAGEVRGTIESLDQGMSDRLRQAIAEAVSA